MGSEEQRHEHLSKRYKRHETWRRLANFPDKHFALGGFLYTNFLR